MNCSNKLFALLALAALSIASCKKDSNSATTPEPQPDPYGKVAVSFANEVDGQPLQMGSTLYSNANGNQYNVSLLKYYVTNFTLVKNDGTETNFKTYKLIDGSDTTSGKFTLDSVANGTYTSVRFYLGVDSTRNHTGAQDGDLDPIHGMIWSWSTGYIFFKHEGQYKNSSGTMKPLLFHLGTDAALTSITVPVTPFEVRGNSRSLFLKFNLNSLYTSPVNMDFNVDNNHQSTASTDRRWIEQMQGNLADAFLFDKVQ